MKMILVAVLVLGSAVAASAQQVVPVFVEAKMKKQVKGEFTVVNNSISQMPTTIEAKMMVKSDDGQPAFRVPSPDIVVELKDTSSTVAPKGQRTFEYRIVCPHDCAISFFAGMMTGKPVANGVTLRLWIPSTVYVCMDSAKDCRVRTKKALGITE
jgi:hypothetical protein